MEIKTLNVKFTPERFNELISLKGELTWEEFFISLIEGRKETLEICNKYEVENEIRR